MAPSKNLNPEEELQMLQQSYKKGEIGEQEFNERRIILVNKITQTDVKKFRNASQLHKI